MIVEEPQDTNAALEQRRMMGTQVSISPGCGEFIFGLDRRRLFQLRVGVEAQKNHEGPKLCKTENHLTASGLLLTVFPQPAWYKT
jgi:hypothetical protein